MNYREKSLYFNFIEKLELYREHSLSTLSRTFIEKLLSRTFIEKHFRKQINFDKTFREPNDFEIYCSKKSNFEK